MAAAGVKFREGVPRGVATHARRAAELLCHADERATFLGLRIAELVDIARQIESMAASAHVDEQAVLPVFPFVLRPQFAADAL